MDDYELRPVWVDPAIRDFLIRKHNLGRQSDMALFSWLMFVGQQDHDDHDRTVVTQALIEQLYNTRATVSGTLSDWRTLTGIQVDVLGHRWIKHKATTVRITLPDDLASLIDTIGRTKQQDKPNKVDLVTGDRWTEYLERQHLEEQIRAQSRYMDTMLPSPTNPVIEYASSSRVRNTVKRFIRRNEDIAQAALDALPDEQRARARARYSVAASSLLSYRQVGNSPRIYPFGPNLVQVRKPVREAAFGGCWEVDLECCQPTIASTKWLVGSVQDILSGGPIWPQLASDMGVDEEKEKGRMKTCISATLFGGGTAKMVERIGGDDPEDFVRAYKAVPWVDDLFRARDIRLAEIVSVGGIVDAWGVEWGLRDVVGKSGHAAARSLMAREIQSWEQRIMLAGFRKVAEDSDLVMPCWIHDGAYLTTSHHKDREASKVDAVRTALEDEAHELGFTTMRAKKKPLGGSVMVN